MDYRWDYWRHRWGLNAAIATAALALLAAGLLVGRPADQSRSLAAGPARLVYDGQWSSRGPDRTATGVAWARRWGGLTHQNGSRLEVGALPTHADLRTALAPLLGRRSPTARPVRIRGRDAVLYEHVEPASVRAAYVFPLSDGTSVAVACRTATRWNACQGIVESARVAGLRAAEPDPASAAALAKVVGRTSALTRALAPWLHARRLARRASAARRMAGATAALATVAHGLVPHAPDSLQRQLFEGVATAADRAAADLRALGAAARGRHVRRYARAAVQLDADEGSLRQALLGLGRAGYALVPGGRA